jgi:AraC family transcriptional regulator, transcriptional activator of pobA
MDQLRTKELLFENHHSPQSSKHFNVFRTEEYCVKPTPYSRRDFYKINLVLGKGRLIYADKGIDIDRPALIFFNPLIPYAWDTGTVYQGYFCIFTEEFLVTSLQDSPLYKIGAAPVFFLEDEQVNFLVAVFRRMMEEVNNDYIYKYDISRNYVNLIIHEALKLKPDTNYFKHNNASERIAAMFIELLDRQFPVGSIQYSLKLRTANDFASTLSVHVNHLNSAVRKVTGKTTTQHITDRVVNEAKALLLHTNWNVAEIAYSLGFEYPTYFNNFFKKQTGLTPLTYRK